jgi:DNA-binding NarL/FixJ family response regulator
MEERRVPREGLVVVIVDDQPHYYPALLGEHLAVAGHSAVQRADRVEDVIFDADPDVVVCDLRLSRRRGLSGEAAVRHLVRKGYRVLSTTANATEEEVLGAVFAGAVGYISKACGPKEHLHAVLSVATRGFFVGQELAALLVADARRLPLLRSDLSVPELDMVREVACGDDTASIGVRYRRSPQEVEVILRRALDLGRRRRQRHQLSARTRQVVELAGCQHLSRRDIAQKLNITDDTLGGHLTRIRNYYLRLRPTDAHIKPMAAAEALARLWGLCEQDGPAGSS